MIAADAGDRVAGAARHADMAELAMPDPARGLAVNYQPDADPGPNRDIGEIVEPLPRAPANLGERRAVDVGVEPHRPRERRCDPAEHRTDESQAGQECGGTC